MKASVETTNLPASRLSGLRSGERAVITDVCDGDPSICHRLHLLGFTCGREVSLVRRAPFHGPMVFRVCDAEMCLRESQATMIKISMIDAGAALRAA